MSSHKLLAVMFLQKRSIMQVIKANILMGIFIVKNVCHDRRPLSGVGVQ